MSVTISPTNKYSYALTSSNMLIAFDILTTQIESTTNLAESGGGTIDSGGEFGGVF